MLQGKCIINKIDFTQSVQRQQTTQTKHYHRYSL